MSDSDNLNPQLATRNLQLDFLPCDRWHHFYHYQSSAQYVWLGATLCLLGRQEEALKAYERAVFQDHLNEEAHAALSSRAPRPAPRAPVYDKHPLTDIAFRASVGELPTDATEQHDKAVQAYLKEDLDAAFAALASALRHEPVHSNSYFLRGKCYVKLWESDGSSVTNNSFCRPCEGGGLSQDSRLRGNDNTDSHAVNGNILLQSALSDFMEAVRLSQLRHDAYHRLASHEHLARGKLFLKAGGIDIAINAFTKAFDLHRHNKEALAARAAAYRMKGNERLALEDEEQARRGNR